MSNFIKTTIYSLCNLNKKSLSKDDNLEFINYLDTGNITMNKIDTLQYLSSKNKHPSRAKRRVNQNTIIYSTVRPNQKHYGIIKGDIPNLIVSTGFTTIDCRNDKEIDSKFLYYFLTQNDITNYLHGIAENSVTSYPSIKPEVIGNLNIKIPDDTQDQQKIAHILSTLDEKIELNNRINDELEKMAKTLYDYWFVQFDFPFDFTQDKPDENGKPYKSSGGKMVYNEKLKREIPEGWEVKKIGKILYKYNDTSKKVQSKDILSSGNFPVITQDTGSFISGYTNEPNPITNLPLIIFGDHSCTLRYVDFTFFRGADGTQILKFESNLVFYIYLFLESVVTQIPNYGKYERHFKYVKDLKVVIPPKKNLISFQSQIQSALDKAEIIRKENQKLAELRDWLLPMLMNGQVEVV